MKIMKKLNQADWAYFIEDEQGKVIKPLTNLDNIRITKRIEDLKKGLEESGELYLAFSGVTVDVSLEVARIDCDNAKTYQLVRSEKNVRQRNKNSDKFKDTSQFKLDSHSVKNVKSNDKLNDTTRKSGSFIDQIDDQEFFPQAD